MAEDDVSIFFILPKGKTAKNCSENLSEAFDTSIENGLNPAWITTEKALTHNPVKTVRILLKIYC